MVFYYPPALSSSPFSYAPASASPSFLRRVCARPPATRSSPVRSSPPPWFSPSIAAVAGAAPLCFFFYRVACGRRIYTSACLRFTMPTTCRRRPPVYVSASSHRRRRLRPPSPELLPSVFSLSRLRIHETPPASAPGRLPPATTTVVHVRSPPRSPSPWSSPSLVSTSDRREFNGAACTRSSHSRCRPPIAVPPFVGCSFRGPPPSLSLTLVEGGGVA
jgi:hypothetical protein